MAISVSDADRLYLGFAFSVAIRQRVVAGFSEVSGLVIETEVETFREGGVNDCERQLAGPTKFPTRLVLKRGMGDLRHLWDWYLGVTQGRIERRDVTIVINDRQGNAGLKWVFREACPVKWTGPELRAASSAIAFEAIDLVHRGVS
ncbi:FIG01123047: hypothetical protein [Caballeronia glathei]|uniref:phage tail protein n=1 Tax=Caballeronia glathei TaxID=60547 RepID=UPI000501A5BF|nr:phage tail protein [Caballeronia glathei]CDY75457.1 FIG01123047: hypothetical protein [Caballeronia glathei]